MSKICICGNCTCGVGHFRVSDLGGEHIGKRFRLSPQTESVGMYTETHPKSQFMGEYMLIVVGDDARSHDLLPDDLRVINLRNGWLVSTVVIPKMWGQWVEQDD